MSVRRLTGGRRVVIGALYGHLHQCIARWRQTLSGFAT